MSLFHGCKIQFDNTDIYSSAMMENYTVLLLLYPAFFFHVRRGGADSGSGSAGLFEDGSPERKSIKPTIMDRRWLSNFSRLKALLQIYANLCMNKCKLKCAWLIHLYRPILEDENKIALKINET